MKKIILGIAIFLLGVSPVFAAKGGYQSIKAGPVTVTGAEDIGTCNNVWALDSYKKFYSLTPNDEGTYDFQVTYKDGSFVTLDGTSPGACETGTDNGNTVAAGITGTLKQEWNRTITSGGLPNAKPDCGESNIGCPSASSFLNAVFGSSSWIGGDWSMVGYYKTENNGSWFDTWTNWPFNDTGDIAGS